MTYEETIELIPGDVVLTYPEKCPDHGWVAPENLRSKVFKVTKCFGDSIFVEEVKRAIPCCFIKIKL